MEELRKLQKEQERERRRLRDRQRRQSMSVEEREKHLARRRRNYQLRRQRAEHTRLDPHFEQTSILDSGDMPTTNQDLSVQRSNDVARVLFDGGEGLDVPAHRLAEFPGKLRLNHLKRLARSLNNPVADNHKIGADVVIKENTALNCISPKGMRLNRVKQLARGLNSAVKETVLENHQSKSEVEQNLPPGECQLMNSDVPTSSIQSNNVIG